MSLGNIPEQPWAQTWTLQQAHRSFWKMPHCLVFIPFSPSAPFLAHSDSVNLFNQSAGGREENETCMGEGKEGEWGQDQGDRAGSMSMAEPG